MLPAVMAVDAVLRVYAPTRFLLVMNIVRLVCVAALIGVFLSAFGLTGAVAMTLLAMAVTKSLGLVRIGWILGLGPRRLLPWRRLAAIAAVAVVSAAPAVWLEARAAWPPLVMFLAGSALYGATYALLMYTGLQMFSRAAVAGSPVAAFARVSRQA
jgi:hypothetical protein